LLVNAMQQLAGTGNPLVRKIRRPKQRAVLWAPVTVADADLDIGDAYASDAARMGEAVRRAESALNRPVTLQDIKDQLDLDPALRPASTSRLFSILSAAAKEYVDILKDGTRRRRATQRIYRVGKIG